MSGKPSMATSQASSPPRQARESPRLGDEPPLVLRVFSAEVLDPDQWPRSVREVAVEAVLGSSAKPLWRAVDAVLEDGRLASRGTSARDTLAIWNLYSELGFEV